MRSNRREPLLNKSIMIATVYYGIPFAIDAALPPDFSREREDIQAWEAKVTTALPFAVLSSPFVEYTSPFEPETRLLCYRPALVDPRETGQLVLKRRRTEHLKQAKCFMVAYRDYSSEYRMR